jgi:WD40 repeat protein/cellulose biosynthesis protein BcsQ
MIYTFYSYKGGVGRSMALANVAEWFYRKGLRVVVIDWDLEAPGLESFFYSSENDLERIRSQLGLVDVLTSYKRHFTQLPPPSEPGDMVELLQEYLPPIHHALYPIRGGYEALRTADPALFLLPSGWRAGDRFAAYAQAVQRFDWDEFYASYQGEAYFEWLRKQLLDDGLADVVLIDSRTGVTEVGGICSRQLADVVVALCVPNIQNLRGTETMVKSFKREELLKARNDHPLHVLVVPTRIEEHDRDARNRFIDELGKLDHYAPEAFKRLGGKFWDLRVPYVPKYAYLETLAVASEDGQDELAEAYRKLAEHLAMLAPPGSRIRTRMSDEVARDERAAVPIVGEDPGADQPPTTIFNVPPTPSPYVPRPDELEKVVAALVEKRHIGSGAPVVGLYGPRGSGKTVLASAVCHEPRVRDTFKGGVLWVTLGAKPVNLSKLVEAWLFELTHQKPGITSIGDASARLAEELSTRAVLLVIDDVHNRSHLEPFIRGGSRCAHLITTEDESILPPNCVPIEISAMKPQESLALLGSDLPQVHEQEDLLTTATRLGKDALPFAIALVNGMIRRQVGTGDSTVAEALSYLDRTLEPYFDTEQTLRASLELLNEEERARFGELSIFAEDVIIPLGVVQKLWSVTGGLDSLETEELCFRLHEMSLLQLTTRPGMVQLHPVLRAHLAQQQGGNIQTLHRRFLEAYRPAISWADLPPEEGYLWETLAYHLVEAGLAGELVRTVKDLRYLAVKTFFRSGLAAEQDLLMAEDHRPLDAELARDPVMTMLRRNFVNAAHLLGQCETLRDVSGTLHSRVAHQPFLEEVASAAEAVLPRPFLTARHPLPDLPDPSLGRTLLGHDDVVRGCAISADGRVIVSASDDSTIKLWDALLGTELTTLTRHTLAVGDCAISRDRTRLVSASEDTTLTIWDYDGRNERASFRATLAGHRAAVSGCDISADGRFVVSASDDSTLKLWDGYSGRELRTFIGHTAGVRGCAISADGLVIISASLDDTLKIWRPDSCDEIVTLRGHEAGVRDCAISADGSVAVSASRDSTLKVWEVASGEERRTLSGYSSGVDGCAISADGSVVVSAGRDGKLKVWDAKSGTEIKTLTGHSDWVKDCAISDDGVVIVSSSSDRTLKVWNGRREFTGPRLSERARVEMNRLSVSVDSALVACASSDKTLSLWDADSGSFLRPLRGGHSAPVLDCAISTTTSGPLVVSASSDATLRVWDGDTGTLLSRGLYGHQGGVNACAIVPGKPIIVSASADYTLKVWNLETGENLRTLAGHGAGVLACAVHPDGRRVVSSSDDDTLKVWDIANGTELMTLEGHQDWVLDCALSPDGGLIASASADGTLKVWNALDGGELRTLSGHRAGVSGCAFSPDGTRIVSASGDNTLRVWNTFDGTCLAALHTDGRLNDCAWSSNEKIMAVGNRGVYFLRLVF